ncbi:hypothetical protein [Bacillus thuringiensis]|uniref:hypothetical protein n=1 Tax=Bacillus thuringiensis TaxID=1428 RepID=UPI0021D66211|nr:hypothetical protein [Bacillus thuringiensis]MCU7667574.1 hypothetical protein [Bacillus thuringiensis]
MKLENCCNCQDYNDREEMELIDGYLYCYNCYEFCLECGKAIPATVDNKLCKSCMKEK